MVKSALFKVHRSGDRVIEVPPRFQFWVRRSHGEGAVFSIRFEVEEGKGLLRVARPGVLVDPPARESGFEERLTPAQVRASRFLHVWDGGRKRQGYVLSRLTDEVLNELGRGAWEQMKVVTDGGFCWLVPGVPEEPPPAPEPPPLSPEPELLPLSAIEPMTVDDEEVLDIPEVEPMTEEAPPAHEPVEEAVAPSEVAAPRGGDAPLAPPAAEARDALAPFGRATTLVRHLRREKERDRERIARLLDENARLQAELDALRSERDRLNARLASAGQPMLPE